MASQIAASESEELYQTFTKREVGIAEVTLATEISGLWPGADVAGDVVTTIYPLHDESMRIEAGQDKSTGKTRAIDVLEYSSCISSSKYYVARFENISILGDKPIIHRIVSLIFWKLVERLVHVEGTERVFNEIILQALSEKEYYDERDTRH